MTIEIALLISLVSLAVGVIGTMAGMRRASRTEQKNDAAQMTTVIVKLEGISNGISEIKAEMNGMKGDMKAATERLIIVEQSAKQAHRRIDGVEKRLNLPGDREE